MGSLLSVLCMLNACGFFFLLTGQFVFAMLDSCLFLLNNILNNNDNKRELSKIITLLGFKDPLLKTHGLFDSKKPNRQLL